MACGDEGTEGLPASLRVTVVTCGRELAVVDADPAWQLSEVLAAIPPRADATDLNVVRRRIFWDEVELRGRATLSQIGVVSGATLTLVRTRLPPFFTHSNTAVKLWSATTGQCLCDIFNEFKFANLSPDGQQVVTITQGAFTAKIWCLASGGCLRTLEGHLKGVSSAEFSPDGRLIITTSADQTAKLWCVASGACVHTLVDQDDGELWSGDFSPDGKHVVTLNHVGPRVWLVASGECVCTIDANLHPAPANGDLALDRYCDIFWAKFSPDSKTVLTRDDSLSGLKLWHAASGRQLPFRLQSGGKPVVFEDPVCLIFSPDGRLLLGRIEHSFDNEESMNVVTIWSAISGRRLHVLKGHTGRVSNFAFSADGDKILTTSADMTARIWDASSFEQRLVIVTGHKHVVHPRYPEAVPRLLGDISSDGMHVVTASLDGPAKVWCAESGDWLLSVAVGQPGVWRQIPWDIAFAH